MTTGKTIALTRWAFVSKVMSLLFNTLSRFVVVFLPRSKTSFINNFMAAVSVCSDFGAQENKVCHCFHFSYSICHEVMGPDAMILPFLMLSFRSAFLLFSFTFIKRIFSSSCCLPLEWYHLHIWTCWYFPQKSWFQLVIHPAWHFAWYILHVS